MGTLRVIRGYRTISTEAAEVLASPPADTLIAERAWVFWERKEERQPGQR